MCLTLCCYCAQSVQLRFIEIRSSTLSFHCRRYIRGTASSAFSAWCEIFADALLPSTVREVAACIEHKKHKL